MNRKRTVLTHRTLDYSRHHWNCGFDRYSELARIKARSERRIGPVILAHNSELQDYLPVNQRAR